MGSNEVTAASGRRMPGRIKFAVAGVWLQGLLNAAGAVLILSLVADQVDHGQEEGTGLLRALALVSLAVAGVLIVSGFLTLGRYAWVRPVVITVEVLVVLSGLVTLFSGGGLTSVPGIALAVAVIAVFASEDGRAWFDR
ncbi:hypothetical protein ACFWTC_36970 [Streptomyces sp. NPDC058619]|uniref:hypothetical protein n=1 Tax=unclassified Streptomyces TaxID=2593676 RepID=UPI00364F45C7